MIETEWQEGQVGFWAKQEIDNPFEPPTRSVELTPTQWRITMSNTEVRIDFQDTKPINVENCPINNNTWDGWALLDPDGACLYYRAQSIAAGTEFHLVIDHPTHSLY